LDNFKERKALVARLNLVDDIFFEKVAEDKEACEEILQTILAMPSLQILKSETQKFIRNVGTRSVRLDLWCKDALGRLFNVEMQKANDDDHIRRVRYYCSNLDTVSTEEGKEFSELPEIYIIYITRSDFLKGHKTIYHVERRLAETDKLVYNGINEIYVNTAVDDGSEIAELMQFFAHSNEYNDKFPKVVSRVRYFKEERQGVEKMCDLVDELMKDMRVAMAEKDAEIANQAAEIANKDAEIARLKAELAKKEK